MLDKKHDNKKIIERYENRMVYFLILSGTAVHLICISGGSGCLSHNYDNITIAINS